MGDPSTEAAPLPPGYPAQWEADVLLADGGTVHIRPIRPDDADALVAFHSRQSPESIYLRYFSLMPRLSAKMLDRLVNVDYVDRLALVAELGDELVGVARYDRLATGSHSGDHGIPEQESEAADDDLSKAGADAEVAFLIDDAHQGRGIATLMLEHLAVAAKDNGISRFVAETLPQNQRMLRVFREAGFGAERSYEEGVVRVVFPITPTAVSVEAMHERERRAAATSVRRLLAPRSVAVIGASRRPGTIGHRVLRNILDGEFSGPVYPVHPDAHHVASVRAYPSVLGIPDDVDLAVIVVPYDEVLKVVEECGRKRVGGLVIISAGFAERGPAGRERERQVLAVARRHGMRLIGPSGMGIINTDPAVRLNATFAPVAPRPGRIGLVSQSGGLGTLILDEMVRRGLGVSTFVSAGNKADVSSNDLLQYWDGDDRTDVAVMYTESFGNPRTFARVARRLARHKPVIAVKSARTGPGSRATLGGVTATADTAVDALFHQCGVIRVETLEEVFDVAQLLATQPLPQGRRVAILGNAGGPGVLAADACDAAGLDVAPLGTGTIAALADILPEGAAVGNPVNLDPVAGPGDFERALRLLLADPGVDAALAIYTAAMPVSLTEVADALVSAAATAPDKPVLAGALGPANLVHRPSGDQVVGRRPVPSYPFPEAAARALGRVARYADWRRRDPGTTAAFDDVDVALVRQVVETALGGADGPRSASGAWLDPRAVVTLLGACQIPTTATITVDTAAAAVAAAGSIGYPVAVKALDATGAAPAGRLRLRLTTAGQVAEAYADLAGAGPSAHPANRGPATDRDPASGEFPASERDNTAHVVVQAMAPPGVDVAVGLSHDASFGPLVSFGTGGPIGELLGDRSARALPLTDVDAAEMVSSVRGAPLLSGAAGAPPVSTAALEELLLRVGYVVEEVPELDEIWLDPVVANPSGLTVAGARIRVATRQARPEATLRRLR